MREKRRLLLRLALAFIIEFTVYQVGCYFEFKPIVPIYMTLIAVLCVAYFVLTRGKLRSAVKGEEGMSEKRLKASKTVLIILIPLLFTIAFDILYLSFFSKLFSIGS